jgi:hypothetical protein
MGHIFDDPADTPTLTHVEEMEPASQAGPEILAVVHAWDRAMVGNDADEIGSYMAEQWHVD